MYLRRKHRRPPPIRSQRVHTFTLVLLISSILLLLVSVFLFVQELCAEIAVSDACDAVTVSVNRAIADIMREGNFSGDHFVSFEKSDAGEVTAISCNMGAINELSAEVLTRIVGGTEKNIFSVYIPVGNLTGIGLLMGKGPRIPLRVEMLTTSTADFSSSIVSAGINQSRHVIDLIVHVDVNILVPWCKRSTTIVTEVPIADTVIVGRVPDTYMNVQ